MPDNQYGISSQRGGVVRPARRGVREKSEIVDRLVF